MPPPPEDLRNGRWSKELFMWQLGQKFWTEDLLWIGGGCDVVRDGLAQKHGLGLVLAIFWNLASVSYLEYSVTALDSWCCSYLKIITKGCWPCPCLLAAINHHKQCTLENVGHCYHHIPGHWSFSRPHEPNRSLLLLRSFSLLVFVYLLENRTAESEITKYEIHENEQLDSS